MTAEKPKPYVGITGITTPLDTLRVMEYFVREFAESNKLIMIGVLASSKELLTGNLPLNKKRYPAVTYAEQVFTPHPRALNLFHYATQKPESLEQQLIRLKEHGGINLNGFQINMLWPDIKQLSPIRGMRFVLQIGVDAADAAEANPKKIAALLAPYREEELVTDVLIDESGGRGKPIDLEFASRVLHAIRERDSTVGIGVAGGLSHKTLPSLSGLLESFPDLSIDAESAFRYEDDSFSLAKAQRYITAARELYHP